MKKRPLRIVITSLPLGRIPPPLFGGVERIVAMLVYGLLERGHDIHLFAHRDSTAPVTLVPYAENKNSSNLDTLTKAYQVMRYIRQIGQVDVIHSFSRLAYLFFLMRSSIPKIHSYCLPITPQNVRLGFLLGGRTITFTACSRCCADSAHWNNKRIKVIFNGVPLQKYTFRPAVAKDAPLVFLGRIERGKGPHIAINVAKRTGSKLIIAGFRAEEGREYEYFKNEIQPHIDGHLITYIGPVNDAQKNDLLGKAAALLFPIECDEAFGIVMAESLACGTPVIAFNRGSVPEVIQNAVNGFVCDSQTNMIEAVNKISLIDRKKCRMIVEEKFSDTVIVEQYEKLYYDAIELLQCK